LRRMGVSCRDCLTLGDAVRKRCQPGRGGFTSRDTLKQSRGRPAPPRLTPLPCVCSGRFHWRPNRADILRERRPCHNGGPAYVKARRAASESGSVCRQGKEKGAAFSPTARSCLSMYNI
jgi:hypothetical protein